MRRFYLFLRKKTFYVQFVDPATKKRQTARSTGKRIRDEALMVVSDWMKDGLPTRSTCRRPLTEFFSMSRVIDALQRENVTHDDASRIVSILTQRGLLVSATVSNTPAAVSFEEFLIKFWNFDESPYVQEKLAHGLQIRGKHCKTSTLRAKKYWIPFMKGKNLGDVTRADVKAFCIHISSPEFDLAAATKNRVLVVGTTALKWAFSNGHIPSDVTSGVMTFQGETEKRGVLTMDEAKELFSLRWKDERQLLGNLLSASTGLRAGEVVALQPDAVGTSLLSVHQSWEQDEGLKPTKNTDNRDVPLIPEIRDRLVALAAANPSGSSFIFWGPSQTSPMEIRSLNEELQRMLITLKVGPEPTADELESARAYWKARNVDFHSWRHFWTSEMSDRIEAGKLMKTTGHRTRKVFDIYADHALRKDLTMIGRVSQELFGGLVKLADARKP